jgi:hypothetical protein
MRSFIWKQLAKTECRELCQHFRRGEADQADVAPDHSGLLYQEQRKRNETRKAVISACMFFGLVAVSGESAQAELVLHYRFDGNLKDATGQHVGATLDPSVTPTFRPGRCGDAVLIQSVAEGIQIASPESIDLSRDFTIVAWVKMRSGPGSFERPILFKGHAERFESPDRHFSFYGNQGLLLYAGGQGSWGTSFAATHEIEANDGHWHCVAASYSVNSQPHVTISLDGQQKTPLDAGTFMGQDFTLKPDAAGSVLRIGARGNGENLFFNGLMDELQIYDRALQQEDIAFLWTHPGSNAETRELHVVPPRVWFRDRHAWQPPFGLDRVGQSPELTLQFSCSERPAPKHWLCEYRDGNRVSMQELSLRGTSPFTIHASLSQICDEVALVRSVDGPTGEELARWPIKRPPIEADAEAIVTPVINPVDLGTILPPSNWLLLSPEQTGQVKIAACSFERDWPGSLAAAWLRSAPDDRVTTPLSLERNQRIACTLALPTVQFDHDRDTLHIAILDQRKDTIWEKQIPVMLACRPPMWPRFGATSTKLRYDAPISVRAADGSLSSMDYEDAWKPELNDVVVSLPNGSRFVFWRGSSYVPFWAGRFNAGVCYEWAETSPPPDGVDCVEPLMDKELRYGSVEIVESTAARVHVRWTYQSCDFNYKVWGDFATEDFYFYPDGFGTRVLTITSGLDGDYELSEFIILTPQSTYPFRALPRNLVDLLFLDGERQQLLFPYQAQESDLAKSVTGTPPIVYRIRPSRHDATTAIYFNPRDKHLPMVFRPFFVGDALVTPTYWGCHWPLARGRTTGWTIDDRVELTPAHNSVMTWARRRPEPLERRQLRTVDTLGRSREMLEQQWAWMIGMTDVPDGQLLARARTYAQPAKIGVLAGGRVTGYAPQRRAYAIEAESATVELRVEPHNVCVDPVFEITDSIGTDVTVSVSGNRLAPDQYAWDGQVLWLDVKMTSTTMLELQFSESD